MITLLSPSKGQDFHTPAPSNKHTSPYFLEQSQRLISTIKHLSTEDICKLMSVSEKIAALNVQRFNDFSTPFTPTNSKQAIFSFTGDVYAKMDVADYPSTSLEFAQNHLRILSGLYGVLRPLDLIQPYRLEMKTKLITAESENLYQFWGEDLQENISATLEKHQNKKVINLASNEYFKAIKPRKKLDILTINFKEIKNNKARTIAIFAKRARGLMANYIMRQQIDDHHMLKLFKESGYIFSKNDSCTSQFTFTRPQPEKT